MQKLTAGTMLYHGTNDPNFNEVDDYLHGPAWLTDSIIVAERFARRNSWDNARPRVLHFVLESDLELHLIRNICDKEALEQEHGIRFMGVEEMRDSVLDSGITGWIIPSNYPEGSDILIADTVVLRYLKTEPFEEPAQARRPRPR